MAAVSSGRVATDEVSAPLTLLCKRRSCALVPAALRWASFISPALPAISIKTVQINSVGDFDAETVSSRRQGASEA